VDPSTGGNVISFSGGYGQGIYPSFYGRDGDGRIVQVVTDFCMLDTSEELRSAIQAQETPMEGASRPGSVKPPKPWWRFWGRR
jgi:hypothetical protein